MDWKKAINNIMELLGNINKWYFNEYEEELDTIRQDVTKKSYTIRFVNCQNISKTQKANF